MHPCSWWIIIKCQQNGDTPKSAQNKHLQLKIIYSSYSPDAMPVKQLRLGLYSYFCPYKHGHFLITHAVISSSTCVRFSACSCFQPIYVAGCCTTHWTLEKDSYCSLYEMIDVENKRIFLSGTEACAMTTQVCVGSGTLTPALLWTIPNGGLWIESHVKSRRINRTFHICVLWGSTCFEVL